ncbi:MAG: hypothetical protein AB1643_03050 [Patescibacteria group bacterium]
MEKEEEINFCKYWKTCGAGIVRRIHNQQNANPIYPDFVDKFCKKDYVLCVHYEIRELGRV